MTIAISGQVPAKEQNGMYELEEEWNEDATPDDVVAIVRIRRASVKFDDEKQTHLATMKFTHIEPVDGPAAERALEMMRSAAGRRGGSLQTELDIDDRGDGSEGEDA